jgi:NAD(P)-dependent dehydrogenase (short-subunit alcohol dehydrogenase family)
LLWRTLMLSGAIVATSAMLRRGRRISFAKRVVIISGGSRGLGLEMARCFAAEGAHLALLARDAVELQTAGRELQSRGVEVLVLPCDIRNQDDVEQSVRRVIEWKGRVDVLVNNAGVIQVGPYEHMNRDDFDNALAVHLWGPLQLMQAAIPHMKRQDGGRIVNIASFGGKVAVPHLLPYCASKFALVGLSDGIRSEVAKYGIRVTTVCPGLMRTGSHINASFRGRHEKEFALFAMTNAVPVFSVNSQRAARQIVEACRYGDPFIMIGPQARVVHLVEALFPNLTGEVLKIVGRLLPEAVDNGEKTKQGWESRSPLAPSWLTYFSDRAVERNNEALAARSSSPVMRELSRHE